jgi:putative SOS response-associated peptidase YedK
MCNLYSMLRPQDAVGSFFTPPLDRSGNMPPLPGIFPDYSAPIVRNGSDGRELVVARWGMPTPPNYLVGRKVVPLAPARP